VTLTGGVPPFQFAWSDSPPNTYQSTSSRTVTRFESASASAPTYTIRSITSGCLIGTVAGSATVSPSTAPAVTSITGGTTTCPGGGPVTLTATLAGEGLPFTLTWSDGFVQTAETLTVTRTVDPATSTTYMVNTIRNAAGCSATPAGVWATVSRRIPPTATVSSAGWQYCPGGTGRINVSLNGTAPYFITWSDGFTQTIPAGSPSTFQREVGPLTSTTYTITSISDSYCTGTATGSATLAPKATASAVVSGGGTFCGTGSASVTATLTGTPPFRITWSNGFSETTSSTTVTRQFSPTVETTYTITSLGDASCSTGGTATGSATVTPKARPTASVSGTGSYCAGSSATITANLTGTAPFSLTWSDGVTQTVTQGTQAVRQVSPASTYPYSVSSISDANCSGTSTGTAIITPRAIPTATVSGTTSYCGNGSATIWANLTGTGPFSITWSDGVTQTIANGTSTNRQVSPAAATTYTVTAVSDAYCTGTSSGSATITPRAIPSATVSGGGSYCPGGSATVTANLSGTAPFTVRWSDGYTQTVPSGTVASRQVTPSSEWTYSLIEFSDAYCSGTFSGSATVTARPAPAVTVSGGGTFCEGTTVGISATLSGTAPFTVTWSDGITQTVASGNTATRQVSPLAATTYTATVTDAFCNGTSSGSAVVTPTKKPVITTQPQSKTIAKRSATTLTVATTESGLNYQWYQGASGTTTLPVGTNSPSFTTPKLTATTQYWVKIWKSSCASFPTNSATATITVQ
jgi:hypothetical protein